MGSTKNFLIPLYDSTTAYILFCPPFLPCLFAKELYTEETLQGFLGEGVSFPLQFPIVT